MMSDTRAQIIERLDAIFLSLGFESLRVAQNTFLLPASRFLTNFARLVEGLAHSPEPDHGLSNLLDSATEEELKGHLRLVIAIEIVAVPVVKKIIDFTKTAITAKSPGRPRFAQTIESKRAVYSYVLETIGKGRTEIQAIRLAAKHFTKIASSDPDWNGPKEVGPRTISRIWERRAEIEQEVDVPAMFGNLITTLTESTSVDWEPKPNLSQKRMRQTNLSQTKSETRDRRKR
jgi:hypothetical protein